MMEARGPNSPLMDPAEQVVKYARKGHSERVSKELLAVVQYIQVRPCVPVLLGSAVSSGCCSTEYPRLRRPTTAIDTLHRPGRFRAKSQGGQACCSSNE